MNNLAAPLYITAASPNGKPMLGGMFRMHDQVGFPIDCCIDECERRGYQIDWLEALADCRLNDCLKFDSFIRMIKSQCPDLNLRERFAETGNAILAMFPKMRQTDYPVDTVCRYILAKKRNRSFTLC